MTNTLTTTNWRGWTRRVGGTFAALSALLALACVGSFRSDSTQLRAIAEQLTQSQVDPAQKVITLTDWVHHNKPARENNNSFILSRFRATPLQVLNGGGDCADKSRLLSAMLREIGISSTMVLCFSRISIAPTHTVVEARIGPESFMVVDPAYNLNFPNNQGSAYHDLLELRADPQILDRRLAELIPALPPTAPVYCYKPEQAAYDNAATFNWQKNFLTRPLVAVLSDLLGNEVYRIPRPAALEEPKLAVAALLGIASVLIALSIHLITRVPHQSASCMEGKVIPCGR